MVNFRRKTKFSKPSRMSRRSMKDMTEGMLMVMVFVGAILAIVLLSSAADDVDQRTSTITITNETITLPSSVGGTLELAGRDLVSTTAIVNATNGSNQDYTGNVTLSDGLNSAGDNKTVILTLDGTHANGNRINGTSANVSYVANPYGFVGNAAGRTLLDVMLIFGALGILVFVFIVFLKKGSLGKLVRRFR